ncbi:MULTISPECIES: hypothetical protein [Methylosinus]|uniref:hypothetical protein n=1 Tax=Methylosinus TaxID=425 RepID=UPI0001D2F349|nr:MULTISPECIES: hypothetical protein [Methylosinus]
MRSAPPSGGRRGARRLLRKGLAMALRAVAAALRRLVYLVEVLAAAGARLGRRK